ncbi:hypothetical protein ACQ4PT_053138 [Festuca glaucescens]
MGRNDHDAGGSGTRDNGSAAPCPHNITIDAAIVLAEVRLILSSDWRLPHRWKVSTGKGVRQTIPKNDVGLLPYIHHCWAAMLQWEQDNPTYAEDYTMWLPVFEAKRDTKLSVTYGPYGGVARGCGWQKIGAWINLSAYYIIGIPSAYLIAFVLHVGGTGLWLGIISGLMVQVLLLMAITICTDWDKEAAKATNRVYSSSLPTDLAT